MCHAQTNTGCRNWFRGQLLPDMALAFARLLGRDSSNFTRKRHPFGVCVCCMHNFSAKDLRNNKTTQHVMSIRAFGTLENATPITPYVKEQKLLVSRVVDLCRQSVVQPLLLLATPQLCPRLITRYGYRFFCFYVKKSFTT